MTPRPSQLALAVVLMASATSAAPAAAARAKITAAVSLDAAAFVEIAPGLKIRMGSEPLRIELAGDAARLKEASVALSPVIPPGSFKTSAVERWKCIEDEDAAAVVAENAALATVTAKIEPGQKPRPAGGYLIELPRLPAIAPETKDAVLSVDVGDQSYQADVSFSEPLKLPPLLAEMLRQYAKEGPTMIHRDFPPRLVRVVKDVCGDTYLEPLEFSPSPDTSRQPGYPLDEHLIKLGRSGDRLVYSQHGWVFTAATSPTFRYEDIDLANTTYLGRRHFRELIEVVTKEPDTVTAIFEVGEFSGCFGAGCGDPVNPREVLVAVKKGKMSTAFRPKRSPEP